MVIDSLIVELGLDPTQFNEGQRRALEEYRKTREAFVSGSKDIEFHAAKAGESIAGIRTQTLAMFSAFSGGAGFADFTAAIIKSDSAVGRLSNSIGVSAETISAWQGAARAFGSTAEGMAQTFTTVSDALAGWKVGKVSPLIPILNDLGQAGGTAVNLGGTPEQVLLDVSKNLKAVHDNNPARAGMLGRELGFDPGMLNALLQGPEAVQKMLDKVKELGTATQKTTGTAGELAERWNLMGVQADAIGRKLLNADLGHGETPATSVMGLADWLKLSPSKAWDALANRLKKEWGWTQEQLGSAAAKTNAEGYTGAGAFTSQSDKEAFIRSEAARRGINPDIAMAVARREGFNRFSGDNGTSFGAFQLHVTPGGRGHAVGDEFRKKTGLDPSDPKNERQTIIFALDDARANGWGAYHGAANAGISAWAGINRGNTTTTTTKVDIHGGLNIYSQATDARGIAKSIKRELDRELLAAQSNSGQN